MERSDEAEGKVDQEKELKLVVWKLGEEIRTHRRHDRRELCCQKGGARALPAYRGYGGASDHGDE